jgi:glycosyltransferase involved in cell wall biosynthesis
MRYHIVVDLERSQDDGDLESRLRAIGLDFNFVYAPNTALRETEWSRWTQVLPGYIRAARQALKGMGQHDHLVFLTAGLAITSAMLRSFSPAAAPQISIINFIYRRRFWPVGSALDLFVKRALDYFTFIGVPSHKAAEEYRHRFPDASSRIRLFPTWCGFPEEPPGATDSPVAVFAGGHSMRDYGTLLKALRLLDVPAVIVTNRTAVNSPEVPKNVTHDVNVPENTFAALMMRASVVVVPLLPVSFDAGQSVALQAMCYGKPVIATNTAGLSEYIDHGKTGILVPPSDPEAMAAAIKRLLDDPALAFSISQEARRVYRERYSRDAFVKRIASTFCESA